MNKIIKVRNVFLRFSVIIYLFFYAQYGLADTSFTEQPQVQEFIKQMVDKYEFDQAELVKLFNEVKIRPKIMRSVRTPFEQRPWHTYQMLFVTEWRIRNGVEFWNKHQEELSWAEQQYGVPASIIVATIGVETKYGQHTGEFPVIDALANIGFSDNPRAAFFRQELEEFLLLTREQNLDPLKVMGSYAGAIGQPQFMPSSFRRYAVSFTGQQEIDLSHNEADVIVSIANYYKEKGWETDQPIAIPASLMNKRHQFFLGGRKEVNSISRSVLAEYGIPTDKMVKNNQQYKLIKLQGYWGNEYWLGFHNFDVIKRYNASDLYAMAVFQLSHYIETLRKELKDA